MKLKFKVTTITTQIVGDGGQAEHTYVSIIQLAPVQGATPAGLTAISGGLSLVIPGNKTSYTVGQIVEVTI